MAITPLPAVGETHQDPAQKAGAVNDKSIEKIEKEKYIEEEKKGWEHCVGQNSCPQPSHARSRGHGGGPPEEEAVDVVPPKEEAMEVDQLQAQPLAHDFIMANVFSKKRQ